MQLRLKTGFLLLGFFAANAQATSIDWSGKYRFEYVDLDRTTMTSPQNKKAYFTNHLDLSPKIIAADGVNVIARFNILPNGNYPDSHVGQPFGSGANRSGTPSTGADTSVSSNNQKSTGLTVSQLYLTLNTEYGSLLAGRAPLEFGLGLTHSAGNGEFDHWYDIHDVVGYKFIIGNFFMMPIIGKVRDQSVAQGGDVTDVIWHFEYSNPETESAIGVFHQTRSSSTESSDATTTVYPNGVSKVGGWNTQHVNLFLARGFEGVKFRMEAGFNSGGTGIYKNADEEVKLNGYGVALELDFPNPKSDWFWQWKLGTASGDNPTTTNFEGYQFDRNYDVAFMMFNHPMGKYDLFSSRVQRSPVQCTTPPCGTYANEEALDEEAISNVVFVSPKLTLRMNDRWSFLQRLTWAQLQVEPVANAGIGKDVGYEYDLGFQYRPHDKLTWVNEVGLLFPGDAWDGGTAGHGKSFTFGFTTKAAISF